MAPPTSLLARATAVLLAAALLAGCGKSLPSAETKDRGVEVTTVGGTNQLGASGLATKNTTRLGGADAAADAAAVALATYPGLTPATRPQTVVVVDDRDWTVALAAAALAGAPLRAPLLYSENGSLPTLSAQALAALRPTGAAALGGAQVIALGPAGVPAGYRGLALNGPPATLAARVERLVARLQRTAPRRVIAVGAQAPPALSMPAAGLAAESGAPILPVSRAGVPAATRAALASLGRPAIYAIGPPSAVSHRAVAALARYGPVHRIYPTPGAGGASGPGTGGVDAADNAIAVARYTDGAFGWGVDQPGHGLVFASAARPLDAPAAAPLSANGDYAPLLLLEGPNRIPATLSAYLRDIQPAYASAPEYQPVRGAYNHGWLIGDASAITPTVQAELDAMLEISPQSSSGSAPAEAGAEPSGSTSLSTTTTSTTTKPSPSEPTTVTP
ncbi:MAG TPA: cell wall-binding repeat-containing protein [Solirubrobacteraceae bacterium]|jgi:hypothetical protein|nr:cell wall-binding repeat-containing protein [Solirubrobacteraceae bacterium]